MINHERVSEFLIELIKFADEEDIKLLLANCSEKLIKNITPNNYKIALVHYLFEYINAFIEPKLSILPPLIYEDNTVFRGLPKCANFKIDIAKHVDLYLHLYALSECYYSYSMLFLDEKLIMQNIIFKYNKAFQENETLHVITHKDKTKLLHLLISSYTENKFYYYFYNDTLTKVEIVAKHIDSKREYIYNLTKYQLQDKNEVTFIVNEEYKINIPLKQKLIRNRSEEIKFDDEHFKEYFSDLVKHVKFQDVKTIHSQIIKIIKKQNKKQYCKCCTPNPRNNKNQKICPDCRKLIFNLNRLKKSIDCYEVNEFILSVKAMDFEQLIYQIKLNKKADIKTLRKRRKTKLINIMNKLSKEINVEIEDKTNENYYNMLANTVKEINTRITKSFGK